MTYFGAEVLILYAPRPVVGRTQSFQLRMGHKVAYLYAESTVYRYVEDLGVPKQWFQATIDRVLELYGREHKISKEDVFLGEFPCVFNYLTESNQFDQQ